MNTEINPTTEIPTWKKLLFINSAFVYCNNCVCYEMQCLEYEPNEKLYMCSECYDEIINPDDDEVQFNFWKLREFILGKNGRFYRTNAILYLIETYGNGRDWKITEIYNDLKRKHSNVSDYLLHSLLRA